MSKFHQFLAFLDYEESEANIKMTNFSFEKLFSSREVLLDPMMEKFNVINTEKNEIENLDVNIDNIFGILV